jgi:hypothetical protein
VVSGADRFKLACVWEVQSVNGQFRVIPGASVPVVSFLELMYARWYSFPGVRESIVMVVNFHPEESIGKSLSLSLCLTCALSLTHNPTNSFDSKQGRDDVDGRDRIW